ncbi:unnamed protein product [Urochloa humidicola]
MHRANSTDYATTSKVCRPEATRTRLPHSTDCLNTRPGNTRPFPNPTRHAAPSPPARSRNPVGAAARTHESPRKDQYDALEASSCLLSGEEVEGTKQKERARPPARACAGFAPGMRRSRHLASAWGHDGAVLGASSCPLGGATE